MKQTAYQIIKKCLHTVAMVLVALFVIFEEWGWESLKKLLFWLFRWPLWTKISHWIASLPPYGALACFSIPLIVDELIKLIGLLQIVQGHHTQGVITIIIVKIIGTALLAWIYQITESQLMQIPWFARFQGWWIPWKNQLIAKVKNTAFWQRAHTIAQTCKQHLRSTARAVKTWWKNHISPKDK